MAVWSSAAGVPGGRESPVELAWNDLWLKQSSERSDAMHLSYGMHRILAEKIGTAMLGYPVSVDRSQGYSQYYTWTDGVYNQTISA